MKKKQKRNETVSKLNITTELDYAFAQSYFKIEKDLNPYEKNFIIDLKQINDNDCVLSQNQLNFQDRADAILPDFDDEVNQIAFLDERTISNAIISIEEYIEIITAKEIQSSNDYGWLYELQVMNLKQLVREYNALNKLLNNYKPSADISNEENELVLKIFKTEESFKMKKILGIILMFELKFGLTLSHYDSNTAYEIFEKLHMKIVNGKYITDKQRVKELKKINRGF